MYKFLGVILVMILLTGLSGVTGCSGSNNSNNINSAPDFSLNNLNGDSISLSNFKGRAVLINFWSTTCPPCVAEMPAFQALFEDWSNKNEVVILTVNIGESLSTVKNFMQSNNYSFQVLMDSQGKVAEKYGIQYTPTSILVGKDGEVKYRVIGAFKDKAAILKAVEVYLSE